MKRINSLPIVCGALITIVLVGDALAASPSPGLTDFIDASDSAALAAHQVTTKGTIERAIMGDHVGGHDMRRLAHVIRGQGASISYSLAVSANQPSTIEIEEIDGRNHDVRCYLVFIDGVKTYFRTWQSCGAGPIHYFVQIPAPNKDHVALQLMNQSDAPFAISRIWAFSDFQHYFDQSGMAVPFYLAPTVSLNWHDRAADLRKLDKIKNAVGNHPTAKPAWTTWIAYAAMDEPEVNRRIDYALSLADESKLPLQICFDSWWANTPTGRWKQEKYQQVVWNESKKKFQLSIPNQWSNTPWLSMNQPDLNAFKVARLTSAAKHLAANEQSKQLLSINLDNEPVYWASGNAGLGPDLLYADFNPAAIEAAKRDGVTLDPSNGLDRQERLWLWRNLFTYNDMISRAVRAGLGRAPMGQNDLLRNNVYTQAMMMADPSLQYPMLDPAYPLWESAAPSIARVGGEWNAGSVFDIQEVMHQLPLGRCAAVNAECGNNASETRGIPAAYALGQRYYAPYNYPLDKMNVAAATLDDLQSPLKPFIYQPTLKEFRFDFDGRWRRDAISSDNVQVRLIGNTTAFAIYPTSTSAMGYLTYKLTAADGLFQGLSVDLSGRAFVNKKIDPRVCIRVLAAETNDASKMIELGGLHDTEDMNGQHRLDLSPVARDRSTIFVRIELDARALRPEVLDWCALYAIRFNIPWPDAMTRDLPAQDISMATVRKQNLIVSWRADAELAIAELPTNTRQQPQAAYDHGDYAQAYHMAVHATR